MIVLRTLVTAFLENQQDFLVMKRSPNRKLAPGLWAGIGGYVEPDEINKPLEACLREITEETGIEAVEITDLN